MTSPSPRRACQSALHILAVAGSHQLGHINTVPEAANNEFQGALDWTEHLKRTASNGGVAARPYGWASITPHQVTKIWYLNQPSELMGTMQTQHAPNPGFPTRKPLNTYRVGHGVYPQYKTIVSLRVTFVRSFTGASRILF